MIGDAQDAVAGSPQTSVTFVVLPLCARAGVAGAVDLDDEVEFRPVEVDLDVLDLGVDERFGQSGIACESEEAVLELAARARASYGVEFERFLEDVQVVAAVGPADRGADGRSSNRLRNAASWITFAS